MILYALDKSYNAIGDPIDTWTTAMWYRRYDEEGEMSLYLPASFAMAHSDILKQGNYITNPRFPDHYCIIEGIETKTDVEEGPQMTITGRSLESILRRRIVWNTITADNASLQDTIKRILDENVISPSNTNRQIPNFVFKASTDDRITALRVTCNLHGDNVYNVIHGWCLDESIGFRITPYGSGGFQFELYAGLDYSYGQDTRPWVVFSPSYENLASTTNMVSDKAVQNAALIYNLRTVHERETITNEDGSTTTVTNDYDVETEVEVYGKEGTKSGLDRREMFIESNTSIRKDNDEDMTEDEYKAVLKEEAEVQLAEHEIEEVYTGEVDAMRQFVLGRDFDLGDVVQFVNEYKQEGRLRITEIIHSHDEEGDQITPTFINI